MEIKSSKPLSIGSAKEILAKRKEDGELGYEQSQALDNCEKFARLSGAKTSALVKKLMGDGKISEGVATKIADVWPTNAATLKAILVKDKVDLSEEEIEKIMKELS